MNRYGRRLAAQLALAICLIAAASLPSTAHHLKCGVNNDDMTTTYDGNNNNNNPDLTANSDSARGLDGDDTFNGEGSKDYLCGNHHNDTIHGDGGGDRINGGENIDNLFGDDGNDWIRAGDEADVARGGSESDAIIAGDRGRDDLYGGGGNDTLYPGQPGTNGGRDFVSGDGGSNDEVVICQGTAVDVDASTEKATGVGSQTSLYQEYCT